MVGPQTYRLDFDNKSGLRGEAHMLTCDVASGSRL